jgi:hypothetical protein
MPRLSLEKRGRTIGVLQTGYIIRKVRFWKCSTLLSINEVICFDLWIVLPLKSIGWQPLFDHHIQHHGRVTNIGQEVQMLFSHRRNRELNTTSRGTVVSANGGHTRN